MAQNKIPRLWATQHSTKKGELKTKTQQQLNENEI